MLRRLPRIERRLLAKIHHAVTAAVEIVEKCSGDPDGAALAHIRSAALMSEHANRPIRDKLELMLNLFSGIERTQREIAADPEHKEEFAIAKSAAIQDARRVLGELERLLPARG